MKHPFYCGTQGMDWDNRNCDKCAKNNVDDCQILYALKDWFWGVTNGVPDEIATRMGYDGNERALTWDCPEKTQQENTP